jgi:succinylglutamate desuccinylase
MTTTNLTANTRYIGTFTGAPDGNLLICIGAIHGNEPAGVNALGIVFSLLEQAKNLDFKGKIVGLIGNQQAFAQQKRFITTDLNRQFTTENIARVFASPTHLQAEDKELYELLHTIHAEIATYRPKKLIILDLHTTSAGGGIFAVPTDSVESERVAVSLHAPVVKGLMRGIAGTCLHFCTTQNMGIETIAVAFETGQHNDPDATSRAVAGILNGLRSLDFVHKNELIHSYYEVILAKYAAHLPKLSELTYVHRIQPDDQFKMREGYTNFQKIAKGEWLATDKNGKILASEHCLILMPLYQAQGNDGFFLIKVLDVTD